MLFIFRFDEFYFVKFVLLYTKKIFFFDVYFFFGKFLLVVVGNVVMERIYICCFNVLVKLYFNKGIIKIVLLLYCYYFLFLGGFSGLEDNVDFDYIGVGKMICILKLVRFVRVY